MGTNSPVKLYGELARTWRMWICLAALVLVAACSPFAPQARSTAPFPTAIPTPSQNAAAMFSEEEADVEEEFAAQVLGVIEQARILAGAPCDRLSTAVMEQRTMVTELRSFAALLEKIAAQDQVLERPRTQFVLRQMDDALEDLDRGLAACGITA